MHIVSFFDSFCVQYNHYDLALFLLLYTMIVEMAVFIMNTASVITKLKKHETLTFCLFNPFLAKLFNLNFHPLEVVDRYRDPQLQVGGNYSYLFNLKANMCQS